MENQTKIKEIPIPNQLTDRQITIAQSYVIDRHEKGLTIAEFCDKHSLGTATLYKWQKENKEFNNYLNALQGNIIGDDEREAYQKVKRKIMELATAKNAGVKEIQLFTDHFQEVVQAEKREALRKLGISSDGNASSDVRTVEEKRQSYLKGYKDNIFITHN